MLIKFFLHKRLYPSVNQEHQPNPKTRGRVETLRKPDLIASVPATMNCVIITKGERFINKRRIH